ncbi:hypothetical protein QG37_02442 [Candidozyma auris]|nr:hypothetical protein QG37_02442 [[Candida] auris]
MRRARGYFSARKAVKSELFVRPLKPSLSPRQASGRAPSTIAHRFFFFSLASAALHTATDVGGDGVISRSAKPVTIGSCGEGYSEQDGMLGC